MINGSYLLINDKFFPLVIRSKNAMAQAQLPTAQAELRQRNCCFDFIS
tara:strand:- start:1560 stop:1703 length:144 start_codon:yes stop_codon:yes gene_type:complete